MKPCTDMAKKLAKLVDTTVGYLLGESKDMNVLKGSRYAQAIK